MSGCYLLSAVRVLDWMTASQSNQSSTVDCFFCFVFRIVKNIVMQGTLLDKPETDKSTEQETGDNGLEYGASAMQVSS